ncbi:MAG: hypothetical protein OEW25_04265 [Nitrospira sp.]|nr:hypothetical protein [Nitrospira sp.]MDH4236685.1 hypothetical protein [Nitrospira sp.]MDH4328377.1 hypothetical protein [Nitrospira sp.]MDH5252519.1 hypothetical protein [Nitrospira sp.]
MKLFPCLKLMVGCAVFAGGALLATQAQAHGGLSIAEDMCKLTVGPYMMHFSGYQPANTQEKQFCEDIPATGQTIVVLDYIEQELRTLPAEIRIFKDTGSEENLEAITVFHIPSKVYPNGSIDFTYTFDKPGKFVGMVTVGGKEQYISRFPFSVGEPKFFSKLLNIYMVPVVALVVVWAVFYFMRDKRKPSQATGS